MHVLKIILVFLILILWFDTKDYNSNLFYNEKQIEKLLNMCTSLVCYNDQVALEIIEISKRNGLKIPDDISIISFDDSQLAQTAEIKLTTVAHPKEKLGEEAAKTIISIINKLKYCNKIVIQPELIIRKSIKNITNDISE